ncbi:hypothetical protein VWZ82_12895 [Phaeobacter sp. JH20_41]|uniref:hypothetical protein n=1 Tax=Phaeobacter sp. JH20_41 TaxID=3112498 RepID=UPI003A8986DB
MSNPRPEFAVYESTLKSGSGGGTFDGMEARVSRLESQVDKVEERLTSIEVTLARIEAKLDGKVDTIIATLRSKIDYKWITVYFLGIVAVILRSEIAAIFN